MGECIGIAGRIFGHHYEARYSTTERDRPAGSGVEYTGPAGMIVELMKLKDRTYHADVCSRCGNVVNRAPSGDRDPLR
jgi:hypothetical protein